MIQGSGTRGTVGTYKAESLPNITGEYKTHTRSTMGEALGVSGAFKISDTTTGGVGAYAAGITEKYLSFDAANSSSTYQDGAPVQPNAILIQCCIKY